MTPSKYGGIVRSSRPKQNGTAHTLTDDEVQTIYVLWDQGFSKAHIAREIGCSSATVSYRINANVIPKEEENDDPSDLYEPIEYPPVGEPYNYFLQREDGLIKIGFTQNLRLRMGTLACGAGPLILLGLLAGTEELEDELHRKFQTARKWPKHEWFYPVPELIEYIAQLDANDSEQ